MASVSSHTKVPLIAPPDSLNSKEKPEAFSNGDIIGMRIAELQAMMDQTDISEDAFDDEHTVICIAEHGGDEDAIVEGCIDLRRNYPCAELPWITGADFEPPVQPKPHPETPVLKGTIKSRPAAKAEVMETKELFEMILFRMSLQDLLMKAQRVSKHWETTIDSSQKLQQALFFEPIPAIAFPELFESPIMQPYWQVSKSDLIPTTVVANPFYIRLNQPNLSPEIARHLWEPESSWRKMLICQPPVLVQIQNPGGSRQQTTRNTMGELTNPGFRHLFANLVGTALWKKAECAIDVVGS